jgi:hypothetical protein
MEDENEAGKQKKKGHILKKEKKKGLIFEELCSCTFRVYNNG